MGSGTYAIRDTQIWQTAMRWLEADDTIETAGKADGRTYVRPEAEDATTCGDQCSLT